MVRDATATAPPHGPESFVELYRSSAYAAFDQEHRQGGTFGLRLIEVEQGAIEATDPAVPEFVFVTAVGGSGRMEVDFGDGWRTYDPAPPAIDVQPANQECRFRVPALHLRFATIPDRALWRLLDESGHGTDALDAVTGALRPLPQAARLMQVMWHAASASRPGPATNLILDGAFLQLLGHLLAACGHDAPPVPAMGDARLARALDYVETHIALPLTVGELAAVAAMSPRHFSRAFKAATGEAVWAHVQRRRLERAHEMVLHTDLPLARVAHACGFADASHLARAFRARHGRSPGRERAR